MQDFKKLRVYQDAFELSKDVHQEIKDFRNFRLHGQLFGSVTSICTNLAEMGGYESKPQIKQKVMVCIGEANETEFWLDFCRNVREIKKEKVNDFIERLILIRKGLISLLKSM